MAIHLAPPPGCRIFDRDSDRRARHTIGNGATRVTARLLAVCAPVALAIFVIAPGVAERQGTPPARPQTPAPAVGGTITKGDFTFAYDDRGVSSLAHARDPFGATLTMPATTGGRVGRGGQGTPAAALGLT